MEEDKLEERVDDVAQEAHIQQQVARLFIDAPKHAQCDDHEDRLFAKEREELEHRVKKRRADALKQT